MYDKYTPVYVGRLFLVLHLNCSNSVTVMTTAQTLSFRGAKRRGNPLKRNENTVAVAIDCTCSRNFYRAENLCYQLKQGQKLKPQFRKIVCLVGAPVGWIPTLTL